MAFDAFTGSIQSTLSYQAQKNGPASGLTFPPTVNQNSLSIKTAFVLGGNTAGGANEVSVFIQAVAPGGTATINLQALADVLGFAAVVLVRLKGFLFALLSAAQDSVNGTACSGVTIGNTVTTPNPLCLGAAAHTIKLKNGDQLSYSTADAAGLAVGAGTNNVLVTNNDGVVAAAVLVGLVGATT